MKLKKSKTDRGFGLIEFEDFYGAKCSVQDSSLATKAAIWLGISDPAPQIMASDTPEGGTGWVPYKGIPDNVLLTTRMHLTQAQVKKLLPVLKYFAETGDYIANFKSNSNKK